MIKCFFRGSMMGTINTLPNELVRIVTFHLNKGDVTRMRGVCKSMKDLVDQDKSIHLPINFTNYPMDQSSINFLKEAPSTSPIHPCLINRVQTLEGHRNGVMSLTVLEGGLLASGLDDKTIKIWGETQAMRARDKDELVKDQLEKLGLG